MANAVRKVRRSGVLTRHLLLKPCGSMSLKRPKAVGVIYLEMLNNKIYPEYDPTDIQEIVRILYNQGYKEDADEICNLYAAAGFDFLRLLYEEHQN